jgi:hypothetical protein
VAIFLAAVIVVALILPADERPSDPFGNHTAELTGEVTLVRTWDALRAKMRVEKSYFHDCLLFEEPPCPSIPALVQKLNEIRQYRGKAPFGHLNIAVNLMIKPAPGDWVVPLEAITMRHGNCKAYSMTKHAGAQELGIPADYLRLPNRAQLQSAFWID